jgi:hypothetical protein
MVRESNQLLAVFDAHLFDPSAQPGSALTQIRNEITGRNKTHSSRRNGRARLPRDFGHL